MTLEECRCKIDEIDKQLVPLFTERMKVAEEVAKDKIRNGLPVYHPEREKQVLDKISGYAGDYGTEARMLYTNMMAISRMRQHKLMNSGDDVKEKIQASINDIQPLEKMTEKLTTGCVGMGSYANIASLSMFPNNEIKYLKSHNDVFSKLESGEIDIGVLPVENSSAGSVNEVYDLIMKYRYSIISAATINVNHCLAAPKGATLSSIEKVVSHPQALSQCSEFISVNKLTPEHFVNTALAAENVANSKDISCAVICSKLAAEQYGLEIIAECIQNMEHNRTRFVAIKKDMAFPKEANKISICFSLLHSTGSLYNILGRFAMHGLNLTKIESRPARAVEDEFRYSFYLDFEGVVSDTSTLELIGELSTELEGFSFLGNYYEK